MSDHLHFLATLREDLEAARHRDPAARSLAEVALGYPGVHAVWVYRLAHRMWHQPGLRLPARLISQLARAAHRHRDPPRRPPGPPAVHRPRHGRRHRRDRRGRRRRGPVPRVDAGRQVDAPRQAAPHARRRRGRRRRAPRSSVRSGSGRARRSARTPSSSTTSPRVRSRSGCRRTIRLRPAAAPFDVEIDDPAIYI